MSNLYREHILDHYQSPRNFGPLPGADGSIEHSNPLCGDKLTLTMKMDGDRIADVKFEGSGCAISKASASMMTDLVKGKTIAEAEDLVDKLQTMVTAPMDAPDEDAALGKLAVLSGVREFPARVKCATLAWHTLRAALEGEGVTSTE